MIEFCRSQDSRQLCTSHQIQTDPLGQSGLILDGNQTFDVFS